MLCRHPAACRQPLEQILRQRWSVRTTELANVLLPLIATEPRCNPSANCLAEIANPPPRQSPSTQSAAAERRFQAHSSRAPGGHLATVRSQLLRPIAERLGLLPVHGGALRPYWLPRPLPLGCMPSYAGPAAATTALHSSCRAKGSVMHRELQLPSSHPATHSSTHSWSWRGSLATAKGLGPWTAVCVSSAHRTASS